MTLSPLINLITTPFNRKYLDPISTKILLIHPIPNINSCIFGEQLIFVLNQIKIKNYIWENKQKENEHSIS